MAKSVERFQAMPGRVGQMSTTYDLILIGVSLA
ncbi:hypothetical protein GXY_15529 [Novacetimonas hansenii ATCC 23769]|uniref:Uncharacterized protein n=1 Tax=Novacetimonas hansenii ATCC 23769 TaxID=714995 RepID=D5QIX4_NOVHA|nr:hypothetical protein GXY_15529 [Novacetimonas hansenii ATCC 23769]